VGYVMLAYELKFAKIDKKITPVSKFFVYSYFHSVVLLSSSLWPSYSSGSLRF